MNLVHYYVKQNVQFPDHGKVNAVGTQTRSGL